MFLSSGGGRCEQGLDNQASGADSVPTPILSPKSRVWSCGERIPQSKLLSSSDPSWARSSYAGIGRDRETHGLAIPPALAAGCREEPTELVWVRASVPPSGSGVSV